MQSSDSIAFALINYMIQTLRKCIFMHTRGRFKASFLPRISVPYCISIMRSDWGYPKSDSTFFDSLTALYELRFTSAKISVPSICSGDLKSPGFLEKNGLWRPTRVKTESNLSLCCSAIVLLIWSSMSFQYLVSYFLPLSVNEISDFPVRSSPFWVS